jgi:hypothetical protein
MPYYLLVVGDPKLIPFQFQQQLDNQYAVGRICFDTPEEYARYAKSVVAAETGRVHRKRQLTLFGVRNPDDLPTKLSADLLIRPLADHLTTRSSWQRTQEWRVRSLVGEEATKERLALLFRGEETPALLFTASHGMNFSSEDPLQRKYQGALLCQDWPGPKQWQQSVPPDFYFSGDDVGSGDDVQGMVAFHLASHSVGTPIFDELVWPNGEQRQVIAPYPFVADLPQRLLGHPRGGALAVIGHVGRAWPYSFLTTVSKTLDAFEFTLRMLMDSFPVGYALVYFYQYYTELLTDFTFALKNTDSCKDIDPSEIAKIWMAHSHSQKFTILGDPAARLALS